MESILPIFMLVSWASASLGWKLGKLPPRKANLYAGICCFLLVLGSLGYHYISWWPEWLFERWMVWFSTSWFIPPVMILFFLGMSHTREKERQEQSPVPDPEWIKPGAVTKKAVPWRYTAAVLIWFSGCGIFYALHQIRGHLQTADWWESLHESERSATGPNAPREGKGGFIYQRTSFTCGPTSIANLMRITGVDPKSTDDEMIKSSMMGYSGPGDGGSTVLCMAVGMKAKATPAGYHVKVFKPSVEEVKKLHMPLLGSVLYGPTIHHAVLLCATDPDKGVLILDPLSGYYWENWKNFERVYLNSAIVMYKDNPYEPSLPVETYPVKL